MLFLPELLARAGVDKSWKPWVLALDQLIFAGADLAMGLAVDRARAGLRRIGPMLLGVTAVSSLAMLLMPTASGFGGLGNRPTFENQLLNDTVRNQFLQTAKERKVEIFSLAMTGYYAQSFCERTEYKKTIADCIQTMQLMNVKTAFLPLGVQCDLRKKPAVRDSVVARLKIAGKMAEAAGVVIAIETALSAREEVQLLKEIGSPAIKIYFNFSNPLKEGRDLIRTENTGKRKYRHDPCQ